VGCGIKLAMLGIKNGKEMISVIKGVKICFEM